VKSIDFKNGIIAIKSSTIDFKNGIIPIKSSPENLSIKAFCALCQLQ